MPRRTPAALAVLLLALPAAAQPPAAPPPDPEARPYLWRVVVQTRPHPLLTPAFRDQLRRDLLAALRPGLGPLGSVEVIDLANPLPPNPDPLWQQFADKGFAALDPDPARELTGVKTHCVRVEYRAGAYHLEARQHDGFTGLASPVARRYSTHAPELLGRAAGLILDRDFGLTGVVDWPPSGDVGDTVRVRFRGGRLGPLDRFVRVGDVLAVAAVLRVERSGPVARTETGKVIAGAAGPAVFKPIPREFTLLRVLDAPRDGAATCAVLTRYKAAMPGAHGVVGYRCLRLATVDAPISVRLVNADGQSHRTASPFLVRATSEGFGLRPEEQEPLSYREGLFQSSRPLTNIACITVEAGARAERFPVPVLGPGPVTLRFELEEADEEKAVYEKACLAAATRAADARAAQVASFDAVGKLIAARRNADALARAKAGLQAAEAADKGLGEEVKRLREQAAKSPRGGPLLDAADRQLAAVRASNAELAGRVTELEAAVKRDEDPTANAVAAQAEDVNLRIRDALARGEVEEALNAYDVLVTLVPDDAEVKARRDRLREEWKPRNDAHARAREYLVRTWPAQATVADMRDNLTALREAVGVCKAAGDRYTFRRLLLIFGGTAARLNDLVKALDPAVEADRKTLADAKDLRTALGEIEQDVQAWRRDRDK